jgi:hypothetical protein
MWEAGSFIKEGQIRFAAFQNAGLHSERLRIFGVLGFAAIFVVVTAVIWLPVSSSKMT